MKGNYQRVYGDGNGDYGDPAKDTLAISLLLPLNTIKHVFNCHQSLFSLHGIKPLFILASG